MIVGDLSKKYPLTHRVAICNTLVCCYWCFIIIIPVSRWCSLVGPQKSAVFLFDRWYSSFSNVDSIIPIDVVGMKSYIDSLFDSACVPVGVAIHKLNLSPKRNMPRFVRRLSTRKPYFSVMFFYSFSHWSPSFTDVHFAAFAWDLVNETVLFW